MTARRVTFFGTIAVATLLISLQVTFANAPSFVFVTVDAPNATATSVYGINNRGDIVGFYESVTPMRAPLILTVS